MRVLQNYTQRLSKLRLLYLCDVYTVVSDFAVLYVVKTVNEVCNRSLARARRAYKRYLLTRLCIQLYIVQDYLAVIISEVHTVKHNLALHFGISDCAVCLVRVLPRPMTCPFFGLGDCAVGSNICVYYLDITLVLLRLAVHKIEQSLCACARHNDE